MRRETIRVAIVVTNHAELGDTGKKTGVHLGELAIPYLAFKRAGASIVIASPNGGKAPIDPESRKQESPAIQEFLEDAEAMRKLDNTLRAADVGDEIDALYFPGGHGPMWDLANSKETTALVEQVWRDGGVIAALCHGPAALLRARDAAGAALVKGLRLTCYSDEEERAGGLYDVVPLHLEASLRKLGAKVECSPKGQAHLVRDGQLVTGQNPASASGLAQEVLLALESSAAKESVDSGVSGNRRRSTAEPDVDGGLDDGRISFERRGAAPDESGGASARRATANGGANGSADAKDGVVQSVDGQRDALDLDAAVLEMEDRDLGVPVAGRQAEPEGVDDRLPSGLTSDPKSEPNTPRSETLGRHGDARAREEQGQRASQRGELALDARTQAERTQRQEKDSAAAAALQHKERARNPKSPRAPRR